MGDTDDGYNGIDLEGQIATLQGLESPMSQEIASISERFNQDGFVLVEGFLGGEEIDDLDRHLERYIQETLPRVADGYAFFESSGAIKHISCPEVYDDYFKQLMGRPATARIVSACLDQPVEVIASEVFYKSAHVGSAAPYHQDNAYLYLSPAEAAVVWVALDDVTIENGAVHYARGSHMLGDQPHDRTGVSLFSKGLSQPPESAKFPEVPAIMKRGDASIHHILCAHRSGPNRTPHHRRGYVCNFKSAQARTDKARAAVHAAYIARLKPDA